MIVLGVLRGPVCYRPGLAQAAANVGKELPAIADEKDEDSACNDGKDEWEDHDEQLGDEERRRATRGRARGEAMWQNCWRYSAFANVNWRGGESQALKGLKPASVVYANHCRPLKLAACLSACARCKLPR